MYIWIYITFSNIKWLIILYIYNYIDIYKYISFTYAYHSSVMGVDHEDWNLTNQHGGMAGI